MTSRRDDRWWFIGLGLCAVTACGSVATAPEASGTGTGGTTSGSSGTGGDACQDLLDVDQVANEVAVDIRNASGQAVLLPIACGWDYVRIEGPALQWPALWCEGTCEQQQCGTCGGCAPGAYVRVDPGQTHRLTWPGLIYEIVTPSETCRPGFGCYETCAVRRTLPPTMTVTVNAVSQVACEAEAGDPQPCACDMPGDQPCEIQGPELTSDLTAQASLAAGATGVEVVFR